MELAHHFVAATKTADAVKALSYTKMAGEQALANLAPADALGWFDQALDLFDQVSTDESIKCDLLIGLGTAQRETGDASHRETLLMAADLALSLHDAERLVRAALSNNRGSDSITGAVDEERVNALESALALLGDDDSRERALLLATLASEIHFGGDWPRTNAVGAEALAIARRLDDPAVLLRTINWLHWALLAPDTLHQRLDLSKEALELCPRVGDPLATFHAYQWRAADCWEVGDFVQVDRCHDVAGQLADQLDQPFLRWSVKMRQSCRALLAGELEKSESLSNEALSIGDEGSVPEALTVWGSQLIDDPHGSGKGRRGH